MVIATMKKLLNDAKERRYALGYFEVWNLESIRAIAEAAEERRSPLIIGYNGGFLGPDCGLEYYASLARAAVEKASVPATSLLNEPLDLQQIMQGLRFGFMSIMNDFSDLPFDKRIEMAKKITEICHSMDVTVEAQIDTIPSAIEGRLPNNIQNYFTDPKKASAFVEETQVDALSISVGNVHGLIEGKAQLDFTLIGDLSDLGIPLVLHGGTGLPDEVAQKAIELGVNKINVGAELRNGFLDGTWKELQKKPREIPEKIFKIGEENVKNIVKKKMEVYGCAGRV